MYWSSLSPPWWWDMESTWEASSPGINRPYLGFPGGSDGKESACNMGDQGSIPGLGRSPGEGTGYPLQYSCLESSMDRGAWQATDHRVTKSWTRLSMHAAVPYKSF